MSKIPYDKVSKVMAVGSKKGKTLYGPRVYNQGTKSSRELAKDISASSTMSPSDAKLIDNAFGEMVTRYLLMGYIVDLGAMGNIRPKFDSKAVDTLEECDANSIRRISVQFKGSDELKEAVDKITFEYRPSYTDTTVDQDSSVTDGPVSPDDSGSEGGGTTPGGDNTGGGGGFVG